jgi:hypothetical protein
VHVLVDGQRDGGAGVAEALETTFTGTPSASSRVACVAQVVQPDRQSLLPTVGGIFEQFAS